MAKVQWTFSSWKWELTVGSLQLFSFENQVKTSLSRFDELQFNLQLIQSIL